MQANDLDQARDALQFIPPDLPRDEWVKVGFAFHAAGGDFDTFDQWSATADSYKAQDTRTMWKSIKPGKGINTGTLIYIAKDYGYSNGGERTAPRPRQAPRKAAEPPRKPAKGYDPAEVWARCEQATNEHPYIKAKKAFGVPLEGLRVLPANDPLCIAGESMRGSLVVPIRRADDSISSLQFIPLPEVAARLKARGKPGKLNLTGATMQGWHTVGELVPGGVVYVCEGLSTAWECWRVNKDAAVACCGWGRVRAVAAELRARDATAKIVICPDRGKEPDADKIALEVGAFVAYMPQGEANNFDASDLAMRDDGYEALGDLLERAREPAKPEPLLKPVSVFDVLSNPAPPPEFVWAGYLPRGVASMLGAHGGTGKSTIALMLEISVALGRPLFGIPTGQCKTLFVSLEDGAHIIRHRLAFICRAWAIDPAELDGKLHIVDGCENPELFGAESRGAGSTTASYAELRELVQSLGAGLVVIDNASDAFGGDEIQRRQVRAFVRALAEIARQSNCAVLLLAHVDKGTSRARVAQGGEGYSGSTAWHNSVRSRLFMSRAESGALTLEHQKSNLGLCREPLALTWPDGGLPQVAALSGDGFVNNEARQQDTAAIAILRMIAEFEDREQYCSPAVQARNNVFVTLRSEPAFKTLKLSADDTRRIVNQCQRAKWMEPLEYRSKHSHKYSQRWTLTPKGRLIAGLPAPTSPTSPTCHVSDEGECEGDTSPTYAGGTGEERAHFSGAEASAPEPAGAALARRVADLEVNL